MGQCSAGIHRTISRSFSGLSVGSADDAPPSKSAPVVWRPVTLRVNGIAGSICEITAEESWSGQRIKEELQQATDDVYYVESIRVFIGDEAEEILNHTILSDVLNSKTADLLLVKTQPTNPDGRYNGEYVVVVDGAELMFCVHENTVKTTYGSFDIEWFNAKQCRFKMMNRSNHISKWTIEFLSNDPLGGFVGRYESNRKVRNVAGMGMMLGQG